MKGNFIEEAVWKEVIKEEGRCFRIVEIFEGRMFWGLGMSWRGLC